MKRFTPELIEELAKTCKTPTGDVLLDQLHADYDQGSPQPDSADYYRFLFHLSKQIPGLRLVELGCKYGAASLHFLKGGGASSVMVDCGTKCRQDLFRDLPYRFANCRSTSQEAVDAGISFGRPDIVFIDTDHSYGTTAQEFAMWSEIVKPDGMIFFDDVGAYSHNHQEDFACGRFWSELMVDKPDQCLDLPDLHPSIWGFGIYFMEK